MSNDLRVPHIYFWILVAVMALFFGVYSSCVLFNTKGEPREAIVAVSMLQSGNWILPVSFGEEMPYKPPMLAWCIAAVSWLTGGHVSEFTSRLPSLLAALALVWSTIVFFSRHTHSLTIGCMTGWILLTSLEVFRAASACRVDMLLTAFMVGAIYSLYNFFDRQKRKHRMPWLAILLMTGAVLTKGPVGMVIPCFVIWLHRLLCGDNAIRLTFKLILCGILACVLPAVWYWLAYNQGGRPFVELAMEENLGRMTGTMSYESHVNPWWYNIVTLVAGLVPYTLLAVLALFSLNLRGKHSGRRTALPYRLNYLYPVTRFALTVALVVFVFYCIPASKRSVYLLPMYPFMAYFLSRLVEWMCLNGKKSMKAFSVILTLIAILTGAAYFAMLTPLPSLFTFDIPFRPDMRPVSLVPSCVLCGLAIICGIMLMRYAIVMRRTTILETVAPGAISVLFIYSILNNSILPSLLSDKSDCDVAMQITALAGDDSTIYSYVEGGMVRFYTANFYLSDRIRPWTTAPAEGWLLVGEKDSEELLGSCPDLSFERVWTAGHNSCDVKRQRPVLFRFGPRKNIKADVGALQE